MGAACWSARERWMREVACCHAEPECVLCPLRPENERRSLAELAAQGLKGNMDQVPRDPDNAPRE